MAQRRESAHRPSIGRPRRFGGCPAAFTIALPLAAYSSAFAERRVECECSASFCRSECTSSYCFRICAGFCERTRPFVIFWWEHPSRIVDIRREWRRGS